MYREHVPAIRAHALASPQGLASVISFVLLSIRQPFGTLDTATRDVKVRGRNSAYLWGWKQPGWDHVHDPATIESLHARLCATEATGSIVPTIDILACEVPGLGIVKGAFVAQMLGHEVACFDSRNLSAMEMPSHSFRNSKPGTSDATRHRRIAQYVQITQETGGARHWWDTWCSAIAPSLGMTPEEVSERHVRYSKRITLQ